MWTSLAVVDLAVGSLAAGQESVATDDVAAKRIVVLDDIRYRTGDSDAWRLDLAMLEPDGEELRGAIVIIHGGGWRAGTKQDRPFRSMLLDYALKGYVTISVEYRLTGEAPFPACIEDVKCAVRWLRAHAAHYGVDPERISCYGHSAGAHLALMLAMCPESAGLEGDGPWGEYSSAVQSAVGGATPTDLRRRFDEDAKFSPIDYVTADVVPILLIHGSEDETVSVDSVDRFVKQMKAAGADNLQYLLIEGGNHGTAYDHHVGESVRAMDAFFAQTLQKAE
jgi:acetyl esterase/lipase